MGAAAAISVMLWPVWLLWAAPMAKDVETWLDCAVGSAEHAPRAMKSRPRAACRGGFAAGAAISTAAGAARTSALRCLLGPGCWALPRPSLRGGSKPGVVLHSAHEARRVDAVAELEQVTAPVITWPDAAGPFRAFETFGWAWRAGRSLDENLLTLAFVGRLNCFKQHGYTSGQCSAVLCRPPRPADASSSGRMEIDVVGFGVNAPPRFTPASGADQGLQASTAVSTATVRQRGEAKRLHNEIHAEMQLLARCARAGVAVRSCWLYVALPPCFECSKALIAAGLRRIVFRDYHRHLALPGGPDPGARQRSMAEAADIRWEGREPCREMEAYVEELWSAWKAERGLDRARLKALASEGPL